jgi:hypothetical protein
MFKVVFRLQVISTRPELSNGFLNDDKKLIRRQPAPVFEKRKAELPD